MKNFRTDKLKTKPTLLIHKLWQKSETKMDVATIIILLTISIIFLTITFYIVKILRNFLINSVMGIVGLLMFNLLKPITQIELQINLITILLTGLFGLAGVALLIILRLFGIQA